MGYGSVHINVNNRYVNHYNRYNNVNRTAAAGITIRASRRMPHADRNTANRYGGTARVI
jgi:hypothetical protein